jgi:glycosyltransferase involved in cell wall biosynthesis
MPVRIVQVSDSLDRAFGGTAAACASLSNHLAASGVEVAVMTPQAGDAARCALDTRVTARECRTTGPRGIGWRLGPFTDAPAVMRSLLPIDVAHIHGLWRMPYLQTARTARRLRMPLVVSAHGMLHPAALERRSLAKRLFRWLVQDRMLLDGATCLHATAADEADSIRQAGYRGPIAIVPWGIDHPPATPMRTNTDAPRLVYLGRLHPSKGLDALLTAWARIAERFPAWQLLLAGYDRAGYRATLQARVRDLRIVDRVTFNGPVAGADREALFAAASIIVLPSPAENFGLVIAEALARGIPAIATTGAPWRALDDEGCGWLSAPDAAALATTLVEALSTDEATRSVMGARGRRYALPRFDWDRIAHSMVELYEWVVGRGSKPDFVLT